MTISSLRLLLFPVLQRKIDRVLRYRKGRKGDAGNRKRQNNSLPSPRSEAMKLRRRPAMRTGSGASRAHGRSSPMIREDAAPPCLSGTARSILSGRTLSIFSVELIPSMRASGRTARHAGTVSICEPTQTGSPRRNRDACTRPPIYVHAHARARAKVDPATGRHTLIQR